MLLGFVMVALRFIGEAHAGEPRAGHTIEAGTGWQNSGATRAMTWEPGVQGSRKDVPVFVGWSRTGHRRLYYAPSVRLQYTNTWSMGGAMNLLGVELGLGGLGVYLTEPPRAVVPRMGRWFVTAEVDLANLRIGANLTPNRPGHSEVPDPDAHRDHIRELQAADRTDELDFTIQHYPFGNYSYVALAFPVQIRAWKMIREDLGVGFFFESTVTALEWPLDRPVSKAAFGYNVVCGLAIHLAPRRRR
ncbi:hypothetical protein [Paraliomyxa miuraensis]|uniref:hypothetical protein n=1 Tax=Paraliomyxa miuraensis TaxID=376150 RepID=UPI0022586151|nr:hypothetical protein [Paraliomyxa miuraensis]MCX4247968.1 hypothetical protein [Paraliomyxa miuraensis]